MKRNYITGKVAKAFYFAACDELSQISSKKLKLADAYFLNKRIRGYWKYKNSWVGFDNHSRERFAEYFEDREEAIKYSQGKQAVTHSGRVV